MLDAVEVFTKWRMVPVLTRRYVHDGCGGFVFFDLSGGFCAFCWAENLEAPDYAAVTVTACRAGRSGPGVRVRAGTPGPGLSWRGQCHLMARPILPANRSSKTLRCT